MAKTRKTLFIVGLAASILFAPWVASEGGQNSLVQERNLRDALISDPPFSTPTPESVAQAAPPPRNTQAPPPAPAASPYKVPENTAPAQVQPAYVPTPPAQPAGIPEVIVRGYSMDPSGAINLIGMDGVVRTIDGSKPVKLVFPREYGLAPQIVGGTRPASQQYPAAQPAQLAVRGYSINASGTIIILGMDGVFRKLDGSVPVTLVFPPEYGIAPQTVGGGAAPAAGAQTQVYPSVAQDSQQPAEAVPAKVSGSGAAELPATIMQEGIGAVMRQIQKGQKR